MLILLSACCWNKRFAENRSGSGVKIAMEAEIHLARVDRQELTSVRRGIISEKSQSVANITERS
jgi:hypothetical protein